MRPMRHQKNLFDAKMTQNVLVPVWVTASMIRAVEGRTTEHVSIKLNLYFSKFPKSGCEFLHFEAQMVQEAPLSVWVRMTMIGAVAHSNTDVRTKLTFYFSEFHHSRHGKTSILKHKWHHFRSG